MSREPAHGPQPNPDGNDGMDPLAEQELDQLLADASALASEVTAEIGAEPLPSAAVGLRRTVADSAPDIDTQLKEIDHVIQTAGHDLGSEAPAFQASAPAPNPIPDFMEEFTRSAEPVIAQAGTPGPRTTVETTAQMPQTPPPVLPDFMDEFTRPEAPPEPRQSVAAPRHVPAALTPALDAADDHATYGHPVDDRGVDAVSMHVGTKRPARRRSASRSLAAGKKALTLLEWIDRPIQKMGLRARRMIGWISIAALALAGALVLAASLVM